MTWFKLDDQFPDHPKMLRAGPDAGWLYVCGGCYCSRHLTDGLIPKEAVATLSTLRGVVKLAARLVAVGAWHDVGDSYEMHAYLDYNPSREQVEDDRRKARERRANGGKRSGERRANVTNPDPTRPDHPSDDERRKRRPPPDFSPTDEHRTYAESHALNLEAEKEHWVLDCEAKNRTYAKLNAGFSTWLRQAVNFGRGGAKSNGHKPERCPKCANTGGIVVNGEVVDCDCIRAFL